MANAMDILRWSYSVFVRHLPFCHCTGRGRELMTHPLEGKKRRARSSTRGDHIFRPVSSSSDNEQKRKIRIFNFFHQIKKVDWLKKASGSKIEKSPERQVRLSRSKRRSIKPLLGYRSRCEKKNSKKWIFFIKKEGGGTLNSQVYFVNSGFVPKIVCVFPSSKRRRKDKWRTVRYE